MTGHDFDLYRLSEDHDDLRAAVRDLATNKIAPYAADVDAELGVPAGGRMTPWWPPTSTRPHVPEAYEGMGADAVARWIVIEEVARVCASSSLIPGVNKLGSMPIILSGSPELKRLVAALDRVGGKR